jgi:predicted amidohydrolase
MKICVAQMSSVGGDIPRNIEKHKSLAELALAEGAEAIFFPELSITGYEPELAEELASGKEDKRLEDFQNLCDLFNVNIGVGLPLRSDQGIHIGMVIFRPYQVRGVYTKQYLHEDEYPYFVPAVNHVNLQTQAGKISLAICYELSVPAHAEDAFKNGTDIYIACVAKTAEGVEKACTQLSRIASEYKMTVLMSNNIGPCDNFTGGGRSSVWTKEGILAGQLDDINEGILIFDTETQDIIQKTI